MEMELFSAKASVIAAFASGPAVLIEDETRRDDVLAYLLATVEMEFDSTSSFRSNGIRARTTATITDIHSGEIRVSGNGSINWAELIDHIREHPSRSIRLLYDKHRTAVVTASRVNNRSNAQYDGITAISERRGEEGVVILTAD